jgi:hypothetical protein
VYASMIAPKLPEKILKLFDYVLVKLVMLFLIVYLMKKNVTVAIVASIALIVTIMALDKLKFGNEMMQIVGSNISSESDDLAACNCKTLNDIKPSTEEGYLVMSEIKQAVKNGELDANFAHFLGHDLLNCETNNVPVLMSKTQEGQVKLDEIAKAEDEGVINTEEAKILAAKLVVDEAVSIQQNSLKNETMVNVATDNQPSLLPSVSSSVDEVNPVVQEMVQEVLLMKQDETMRRGGVPPSPDEVVSMCASVLNDYKKSPQCGSDCSRQSESVTEDYNVVATDYDESNYSFLE